MVGLVAVGQAGVGLHGGQDRVGQSVHPAQHYQDVDHLAPAVGPAPKAAPVFLGWGSEGVHHGPLLGTSGPVLAVVGPVGGPISGDSRVAVQQKEGQQAHQHHGAEEEEEDLRGKVGGLVLSLQLVRTRTVGGPVQQLRAVDAADHPDPLDQSQQGWQQAAQPLPDEVGGQELRPEAQHEG